MAKKYIDAEALKSIIKAQIKERKKWMKDPAKSDRQDQLWSDLNGEDMSILQIIDILQQEQPEVKLDEEMIVNEFRVIRDRCFNEGIEGWQREKLIARHFYEFGLKAKEGNK